jgi:hypothetical protein
MDLTDALLHRYTATVAGIVAAVSDAPPLTPTTVHSLPRPKSLVGHPHRSVALVALARRARAGGRAALSSPRRAQNPRCRRHTRLHAPLASTPLSPPRPLVLQNRLALGTGHPRKTQLEHFC